MFDVTDLKWLMVIMIVVRNRPIVHALNSTSASSILQAQLLDFIIEHLQETLEEDWRRQTFG